ncbi:MAG: SIS domain-containing protein [Candidatus Hodarchaeales archaeon]
MNSPDYMREEINYQTKIINNFINYYNESPIFKKLEMIDTADEIWFTGSGDSHCASLFGASLLNQLGLSARAFTPMELSNYHKSIIKNPLLIAISVSGKTPRVLEVVKKFKNQYSKAKIIGLTDNPESPLFSEVTVPILIKASPSENLTSSDYVDDIAKQYTGYHHDVAQTKTYFANIMWIISIASSLSEPSISLEELIKELAKKIDNWIHYAEEWVVNHPISFPNKSMFVGSGLFNSLAQFAQYKWFEFTFPGLKQDIEEYAHTHYFATDQKTTIVLFGPFGNHLSRIKELITGALQHLIKPEMYLITATELLDFEINERFSVLETPLISYNLPKIWKEVLYYLFALIFIEWLAYTTARNEGLDTNTFRGGAEGEKYVKGSFQTIRKSQVKT